jgi:3-methyl-2-oxobutanoate hydroxymethyltransferase
VATRISLQVATPTIGIGAGPDCDGQVLVFHDLAGLTFTSPAKFVRRYCNAGELISAAIHSYGDDVRSRAFPADDESYHLPRTTQDALGATQATSSARQKQAKS